MTRGLNAVEALNGAAEVDEGFRGGESLSLIVDEPTEPMEPSTTTMRGARGRSTRKISMR